MVGPSGPNERSNNGDLTDPLPSRAPDMELRYAYDASGERVLKSASDDGASQLHTVYVFGSLELRRTSYSSGDYTLNAQTASVRFGAGPASARVVYAQSDAVSGMSSSQRVFLELSDYLGSSTYLIDRATGELIEFSTYQAYGATESDYRPERWDSFREPYKFTGKEEDIAVGLSYFGARYYSPHLGVWLSPDPVTIHELGSDTNPYAYVMGRPVMAVDPDGRLPFLAVVAIAAAVSAVTSVAVQAATVGWSNIDWGLKGVAGAAIVGAVSGGVGFGVGGLVSAATSASSGALAGGFAGGAAAGGSGYLASVALGRTQFTGGGFASSLTIGAYTGVASSGTGVLMGGGTGGAIGGTVAGGLTGAGLSYATTGQLDGTSFAISLGVSLAQSVATARQSEGGSKRGDTSRWSEEDHQQAVAAVAGQQRSWSLPDNAMAAVSMKCSGDCPSTLDLAMGMPGPQAVGGVVAKGASWLGRLAAQGMGKLANAYRAWRAGRVAYLAARFGTTPERVAVLQRVITSEGGLNTSRTVAQQLARGGARSHISSQSILETVGRVYVVPIRRVLQASSCIALKQHLMDHAGRSKCWCMRHPERFDMCFSGAEWCHD